MIIRSQDGKEYDIYMFSIEGNSIYCQDNADRRRKRVLGVYSSRDKATDVFQDIRRCTDGYFEMPSDEEVEV
jgi:hypothetical protein